MKRVYITKDSIVSPLGMDSISNIAQITKGTTAIKAHSDTRILPQPFHAAIIETDILQDHFSQLNVTGSYTRLEKMMILSLQNIIKTLPQNIIQSGRTGLIVSTTKGNIDALDQASIFPAERAYLAKLGVVIKDFFGFKNQAILLSNACVSGILAVAVAKRLIQSDVYDQVLITSGDLVTSFILSGFNSFQAISKTACQPFSKNRTGINIGEAAASVLVTAAQNLQSDRVVEILGDSSCNDANHISGPSRTGEGLVRSIQSALREAKVSADEVDYVSAHGTATVFNDEMEAIAMNRTGLADTPLNSLKGYYGHTLGASGLLEAIVGIHSLHNNTLYASKGFDELGVSQPINVIKNTIKRPLNTFLKTASGFGGCNTAVVFKKSFF